MGAIFIMESIMDHVARSLGLDVEEVKYANLYQPGDVSYNVSICFVHTLCTPSLPPLLPSSLPSFLCPSIPLSLSLFLSLSSSLSPSLSLFLPPFSYFVCVVFFWGGLMFRLRLVEGN